MEGECLMPQFAIYKYFKSGKTAKKPLGIFQANNIDEAWEAFQSADYFVSTKGRYVWDGWPCR
jgi:hypothetical protein